MSYSINITMPGRAAGHPVPLYIQLEQSFNSASQAQNAAEQLQNHLLTISKEPNRHNKERKAIELGVSTDIVDEVFLSTLYKNPVTITVEGGKSEPLIFDL